MARRGPRHGNRQMRRAKAGRVDSRKKKVRPETAAAGDNKYREEGGNAYA